MIIKQTALSNRGQLKLPVGLLILALSLSLGGCSTLLESLGVEETAPETKPEFQVPAKFVSPPSPTTAPYIQSNWIKTFKDPKLEILIDEVLEKNFDLQIAVAKIESAAASAKKAGADLAPALNLGLENSRSGNLEGSSTTSSGVSLDISWELDVWGRIRAGRDAATGELIATQLDYAFAKLSLKAQTAKAYFLAIETNRQLGLLAEQVANYSKTLEVVNAFFKEGMVSIQDVHLARSEKARSVDALENAKSAHLEALRSLESLLGRYPSAKVEISNSFPILPDPIPVGIPSEVLERRPDIVAAERRVAASFKQITQAKAARLPRVALTASVGGSGGVGFSNLVSNLMVPIFTGGKLEAQVEAANADQKQAMASYQKTALAAFSDIETAISNESIFRKREKSLRLAYEQARLAENIGFENYKMGEGDILDVLQLTRSSLSAKTALTKIRNDLLAQRVNLHLGLGGDFMDAKLTE